MDRYYRGASPKSRFFTATTVMTVRLYYKFKKSKSPKASHAFSAFPIGFIDSQSSLLALFIGTMSQNKRKRSRIIISDDEDEGEDEKHSMMFLPTNVLKAIKNDPMLTLSLEYIDSSRNQVCLGEFCLDVITKAKESLRTPLSAYMKMKSGSHVGAAFFFTTSSSLEKIDLSEFVRITFVFILFPSQEKLKLYADESPGYPNEWNVSCENYKALQTIAEGENKSLYEEGFPMFMRRIVQVLSGKTA